MSLRLSLSFALNSERSGRKRTKTRTLLLFLNGAITDRTMEQRWIQRWKDTMAACFKSGAKDATGTKVANQILSSIPRGFARKKYRKILKMNHGAYIFQGPFWGAYLRREICVSKSIGLALWLEGNLPFLLCFTLYLRAISKYKPLGGLYLAGRFNWGQHNFFYYGVLTLSRLTSRQPREEFQCLYENQ